MITWLPAHEPGAFASDELMVAIPLQSSTAVALPVLDGFVEAVQSMVTFAGQVIVGP